MNWPDGGNRPAVRVLGTLTVAVASAAEAAIYLRLIVSEATPTRRIRVIGSGTRRGAQDLAREPLTCENVRICRSENLSQRVGAGYEEAVSRLEVEEALVLENRGCLADEPRAGPGGRAESPQ
jgi:hypothetical protein